MATTTYPNISINSTNFVLLAEHNGLILVSTLAAGNVIANNNLPAGFNVWVVQMGAGASTITAGSTAATVNGVTGVATTGQYGTVQVLAVADGTFVVTSLS